jgi:glycerol uptake facilitator-like aquaporin
MFGNSGHRLFVFDCCSPKIADSRPLLHSSRNACRFVLHCGGGTLLHDTMNPMQHNLKQRLASEAIGTSFLVAAVVGSGIMGERLANGNGALALLVNTIATGAALVALICTLGPISGAHLNPAVSVADAIEGGITLPEMLAYIAAQCAGGVAGTIAAHLMFGLRWYSISAHARNGSALLFSECVASFGLLCVIWGCSRLRSGVVPFAVASYITAAYWFTSSTSFANPAVTLARSLTNTFTGIRPVDVPLFVIAQVAGALSATFLFRWLAPDLPSTASQVLVPHSDTESTRVSMTSRSKDHGAVSPISNSSTSRCQSDSA